MRDHTGYLNYIFYPILFSKNAKDSAATVANWIKNSENGYSVDETKYIIEAIDSFIADNTIFDTKIFPNYEKGNVEAYLLELKLLLSK